MLFGIKGHLAGDLFSVCPHRQFHTLPSLLHNQAALPNFNPYACLPSREAVCTISMMLLGVTQRGLEPTSYHVRGGHAKA